MSENKGWVHMMYTIMHAYTQVHGSFMFIVNVIVRKYAWNLRIKCVLYDIVLLLLATISE